LRAVLEQLGHQVVHAHNGRRALELAELCQFDLIMLDGKLPMLAGAEAAADVRALAAGSRNAPIVGVIGSEAEEAEACLAAGVDQVLRRPASVSGVARVLAAAMERKAQPAGLTVVA